MARKAGAGSGSAEPRDDDEEEFASLSESDAEACPIGSAGSPRLQAKAKRQKLAAKRAAKAARANGER